MLDHLQNSLNFVPVCFSLLVGSSSLKDLAAIVIEIASEKIILMYGPLLIGEIFLMNIQDFVCLDNVFSFSSSVLILLQGGDFVRDK